MSTSKENIATAVNALSFEFTGLVNVVGNNRDGITRESVGKIAFFLGAQLSKTIQDLEKIADEAAVPAPGSFSLDMEIPANAPKPVLAAQPSPQAAHPVQSKAGLEGKPWNFRKGRPKPGEEEIIVGRRQEEPYVPDPTGQVPDGPANVGPGIQDAAFIE